MFSAKKYPSGRRFKLLSNTLPTSRSLLTPSKLQLIFTQILKRTKTDFDEQNYLLYMKNFKLKLKHSLNKKHAQYFF